MVNNRAFSLIEMLVIIILISALALFSHTSYVGYIQRSKVIEALNVLDEYQANATAYRTRTSTIDPYYVLFTDSDQTGLLTGSPSGNSATKSLNLEYVDSVGAYTGTDGNGDQYILLGAKLKHDNYFIDGADSVYLAGTIGANGHITWTCGMSASRGDTIDPEYLPQTCQAALP